MTGDTESAEVVDFWFDPICGWSWIASRWLTEVARLRPITIRWHPYGLAVGVAEGPELTGEWLRVHELSKRFARVCAAVAEDHDNDALAAFYTALGTRIHGSGGLFNAVRAASREELTDARVAALQQAGTVIDAALADAQLSPGLAAAMNSDRWDDRLKELRSEIPSGRLQADPIGVPMISVNGGAALFGPVVGERLAGEAAARFWDAFRVLAEQESFFELKRAGIRPPIREYLTD